jgi:hypothetical protein
VDVPITDEGVDTAAFCEAAENLVKIFGEESYIARLSFEYDKPTDGLSTGLFGNPAFVVVQNDLTGNIAVSSCVMWQFS